MIILLELCLYMTPPFLTALNIDYLTNHKDELGYGIFLYVIQVLVTLVHRVVFSQYFNVFQNLGVKMANLVTMIVYNKSLKYSPMGDKAFS